MVTMDIQSFIRQTDIRIEVGAAKRSTDDQGWQHDAYRVRLTVADRTARLVYRKGVGHRGSPPTLAEVLDSLASDSLTLVDTTSFEEWAEDLGYDTDSRRAERIYNAAVKQDRDLRTLLGPEDYQKLLFDTERL